jgi:H+-transporting ATPase
MTAPIPVPSGLSADEARRRLSSAGPNAVAQVGTRPLRALLASFWAPIPCVLEAAVALQLFLGDRAGAAIVAILLVFNAALGLFQEGRSRATLALLKSRLALKAAVRRDGKWIQVDAAELVTGDIVKLVLGGIVPADVLLSSGQVQLDQSMLTGESAAVDVAAGQPGYAGALVRSGEAVAQVTATGSATHYGRTAQLVRTAKAVSGQQSAVLQVVRNLALFNGAVIVALVLYALGRHMPADDVVGLVLTAILASIPVALPATFTLAAALGAQTLAKMGVLPTRLAAVDEAGTMDVLCADKTGTLTRNALTVAAVQAEPGFARDQVLALAGLASTEGGFDPVDTAVRAAAQGCKTPEPLHLLEFKPFDPARKMAEATVGAASGASLRIAKGAYAAVSALVAPDPARAAASKALEEQGNRVLAVAVGPAGLLRMAGLIALSDGPRPDSASLIAQLRELGVRTVMVTGDAPATALAVARAVGLPGEPCPAGSLPQELHADTYAIYAGVPPEDKFRLVKAFQAGGHTVGMCGDGTNDAPALRQAQVGIAVSTANDIAKSAAGMVLTEPGLAGVVAAVRQGRIAFQRIQTYALNSITKKITQVLFLATGLLLTGDAILTPTLMVIIMITGDFLGLALASDKVRPSPLPNHWRIGALTLAGIGMGLGELLFCLAMLCWGIFAAGYDLAHLRALAFLAIVFGNQATTYTNRERRRLWASRPGAWLVAASAVDISIAATLAIGGLAMAPLPPVVVLAVLAAAAVFAILLDQLKLPVLARLQIR